MSLSTDDHTWTPTAKFRKKLLTLSYDATSFFFYGQVACLTIRQVRKQAYPTHSFLNPLIWQLSQLDYWNVNSDVACICAVSNFEIFSSYTKLMLQNFRFKYICISIFVFRLVPGTAIFLYIFFWHCLSMCRKMLLRDSLCIFYKDRLWIIRFSVVIQWKKIVIHREPLAIYSYCMYQKLNGIQYIIYIELVLIKLRMFDAMHINWKHMVLHTLKYCLLNYKNWINLAAYCSAYYLSYYIRSVLVNIDTIHSV